MTKLYQAETFIGVLSALIVFSILFLGYSHWQQQQTHQINYLYQQQQALQIADNQISLQLAHLPCEKTVQHNQLTFHIECGPTRIQVTFPLGKTTIISK